MPVATKKTFANGKVREVRAGRDPKVWGDDAAPVIAAGAVTMCLNTVCEFLHGEVIDRFVWQGDHYYSSQSDRVLYR